jgi:predicted  nucleic acid-binding Zn-ribbon protein
MDEAEHRLSILESELKTAFRRIDEIRDRQTQLDDLVVSVKQLAIREENVEADVKEIKTDVKALTSKPAERWNDLVKTVIGIVVAGVVGFLMAKVGL